MRTEIQKYLRGKSPYAVGLELLRQSQSAPHIVRNLERFGQRVPPARQRRELRAALVRYLRTLAPGGMVNSLLPDLSVTDAVTTSVTPPLPAVSGRRFVRVGNEPHPIVELLDRGAELMREYAEAKHRLVQMTHEQHRYDDEDRALVCRLIMEDLVPAIDACYNPVKAWRKTGELPAQQTNAERDLVREVVAKFKRVLSLRTRLRKIPNLKRKTTDPNRRKALAREEEEKRRELKRLSHELHLDD